MVPPSPLALVWAICGIACTALASRKNRHPLIWTVLGWSFALLALGVLYFLPTIPYHGPPLTQERMREAPGVGCLGFIGLLYLWGVVLYFTSSVGTLLGRDAFAVGILLGLLLVGPAVMYWAWNETRRYYARRIPEPAP